MGLKLLARIVSYLRRLALFIGPGFMIAVGYLDPGNWATNIQAGSQFGYRLLFIILVSNLIALFLQNLTIRLGTVSGLDLAAACRHYLPRYLSLFLYILAEVAIVATDLAEVIGSAIALNLLFPTLPLPAGVAITAADVFIILLCYKEPEDTTTTEEGEYRGDDDTARMVRYFEMFVMLLVAAVGICFIIEMAYSDIVAVDVLKGYLPTKEIFTDTESLYVSIGIIGATVMPHNLFLHSFIVQARCESWRRSRPTLISTCNSSEETTPEEPTTIRYNPRLLDTIKTKEQEQEEQEEQEKEKESFDEKKSTKPSSSFSSSSSSINSTTDQAQIELYTAQQQRHIDIERLRKYLTKNMHTNLHYGFVDLFVALLFAFFVNSAILVVASANFYFGAHLHDVSDLFDAHALLHQLLGPAAAVIFALALLFAGQSSTLTATLAGQVVMSGFLGMTSRPWLRRILTRLVAIIPAMIAACVAGRAGLSQMLVGSQVALSIQLPFAVVPLVLFTSWPRVMRLELVHDPVNKLPSALPLWLDRFCIKVCLALDRGLAYGSRLITNVGWNKKPKLQDQQKQHGEKISSNITTLKSWPAPIQYTNGKCTIVVAVVVSLLLIGLNGYLVVASILGN